MKVTFNQVLILYAIGVVGAQLPMFILAASIDNDEAAKSLLGWLFSAVFCGALLIRWIVKESKP